MYRYGHHHHHNHQYGHHHYGHHWQNWHVSCSVCRHRIYNPYDESISYRWYRVPGPFLFDVHNRGYSAEGTHAKTFEDYQPSQRTSRGRVHSVSSTRRLSRRSRSHSDAQMTATVPPPPAPTNPATDKCADAKTDPISGFACGSALCNMCSTPPSNEVLTATSQEKPATKMPATNMPATNMPATNLPATNLPAANMPATNMPAKNMPAKNMPAKNMPATNIPPSPSPSHPCQTLLSNALRKTPMFVKHESVQTSPSKTRFRSAFAVIRTDGEPAAAPNNRNRTPVTDGDTKPPTEPAADPPPCRPSQEDANHHYRHHHHGLCWYHQVKQSCGHKWAHPFHRQESCTHQSKLDDDTTWAGFLINISKDDWGGLLKEAWTRLTNIVRRSRGTILLDHNASPSKATATTTVGEKGEHAETAPCYDQHARDEHASYCYAHAATNDTTCYYNHNYYHHRETASADDATSFFYPEKESHNHAHFQEGPEEFYDCFECQVCSSNQY